VRHDGWALFLTLPGRKSSLSIDAGNIQTRGITTAGEIWCWGDNSDGGVAPSGQTTHTEPMRVLTYLRTSARWRL
jgi:hypothetical protein